MKRGPHIGAGLMAMLIAAPASLAPTLALAAAPTAQVAQAASPATPSSPAATPIAPLQPTPNLAAPSPEYAADIRDIRGAKYLFPTWMIGAIAGAVAVLAALGFGIWRWLKRAPPTRALLPFEIALRDLEAIRPLMQPATVRQFSIEVSDIVRRYIEERFDVTAAHRTTEEFLRDLMTSTQVTLAQRRDLLGEFLEQCDLAKFAGLSLSTASMEALYQSARSFVIETARSGATDGSGTAPGAATPRSGVQETHDTVSSA